MLSRTADNIYWLGRYMERAENYARTLDVAHRMSLVPPASDESPTEWSSAITICGGEEDFYKRFETATDESVIEYLAFDGENPSSIYSCLRAARENCRIVRPTVPTEVWEAVNATWLEYRDMNRQQAAAEGYKPLFDWVKERSSLFRGVSVGTMLQDEAFHFSRLGTFLERGDNTARILDVKYHILLPRDEGVGGAVDAYHWSALLRSVSAFKNYRGLYGADVLPHLVAELMILVKAMPRSLHHCMGEIVNNLEALAQTYGKRHECHRLAGQMQAKLQFGRIDHVFNQGLHEYLTDYISENLRLCDQIAEDFLFQR